MHCYLVCGFPHSGKTTWIERNVGAGPRVKIIDAYHVQGQFAAHSEQDVAALPIMVMSELLKTLKEHRDEFDVVVVEWVGVHRDERNAFLRLIRSQQEQGAQATLVWCQASPSTIERRLLNDPTSTDEYMSRMLKTFDDIEEPSDSEGFDELILSESDDVGDNDGDVALVLARMHCGYDGDDEGEAARLLMDFDEGRQGHYPRGATFMLGSDVAYRNIEK